VAFKVGQDSGQVSGALDGGAGCRLDVDAYFDGDDTGQAGLAQAGRPVKQDMVYRLPPAFGGIDSYLEIFLRFNLADEVRQAPGSKTGIKRSILGAGLTRYNASYCLTPSIDCGERNARRVLPRLLPRPFRAQAFQSRALRYQALRQLPLHFPVNRLLFLPLSSLLPEFQ